MVLSSRVMCTRTFFQIYKGRFLCMFTPFFFFKLQPRKFLILCLSVTFEGKENTHSIFDSLQNGRISSMDFHRTSSYLVTASDDESIRLYDVANATLVSIFDILVILNCLDNLCYSIC